MSAFRSRGSKPYSRPAPKGDSDGQWVHDRAPGAKQTHIQNLNGEASGRNAPPSSKIVVSNLHYEIAPKDLTAIFGQIGTLVREPMIRYDRSGRSSGTAIVTFETPQDAVKAKKQFDGILAKGQPMTIVIDTFVPRRASSAPSTSSLLNRIQKPPLAHRLSTDDSTIDSRTASGPGPVRTRGGRKGPGPKSAGPAGGRAKKEKPAAKTAEELDKELDTFMGDGAESAPAPAAAAADAAPTAVAGDVEMA